MTGNLRLVGRADELRALESLLAGVRVGQSKTIVVRGDPGVGKTALLEYLRDRASGCTVVSASGVEAEMELPFAGLHLVCTPMLDRLERLPDPQRAALSTAFGLSAGPPPDRFLVGLAALSLLSDAAEEHPLLCLVDDGQWLDRASSQALAFVARRLVAEPIGLVFCTREEAELAGQPELIVKRLGDEDARSLLESTIGVPLDREVCERIIAETRGYPLALLELTRGLSATQLAGGFGLPDASPVTARIEETYLRRLAELTPERKRLLLIAAAEPTGDPVLVRRAADAIGISAGAVAGHELAGLAEFGTQVRFAHPLARAAVYRIASREERRLVHAALADVTEPSTDPDRRAWHLAQATDGLDEQVAAELERSAVRAQSRGGVAAAAAFLERAASLTPNDETRAERALAAANAKYQAGAFDEARVLITTALRGPRDELLHARAWRLRGQMAFASSQPALGSKLLLETANRLSVLDTRLARGTYLDALSAAMLVGRLAKDATLPEVAAAARHAPAPTYPPRSPDLLLDALATLLTDGYENGAPLVREALPAMRADGLMPEEYLRWLFAACQAALDVWDDEEYAMLAELQMRLAREVGAVSALPIALTQQIGPKLHAGETGSAAMLVEELATIGEVTQDELLPFGALIVAAWRGEELDDGKLSTATIRAARSRREGLAFGLLHYAKAVLFNGLGRYAEALDAAEVASAYPAELGFGNLALSELIESAVRTGDTSRAADALGRIERTTRPSDTEWGLGTEACCRALLRSGKDADALYEEAIDRLGRSRGVVVHARARLVYGESLRRQGRRVDARVQLRSAHETFAATGVEAFAERARRELVATGETVRKRTSPSRDELTPQEAQIALLAAEGLSNPDIGARLFISPRTVQYHLRKVFAKLDISSRGQLHRVLSLARSPRDVSAAQRQGVADTLRAVVHDA